MLTPQTKMENYDSEAEYEREQQAYHLEEEANWQNEQYELELQREESKMQISMRQSEIDEYLNRIETLKEEIHDIEMKTP